MIIVNNECDFIMKNIKAVNALTESIKLAKVSVPIWLLEQLEKNIEQRKYKISDDIYSVWIIDIDEAGKEISLIPEKAFDDDIDYGIFYGINFLDWDSLITGKNTQIYLYYKLPEKHSKKMKQKLNIWEEKLIESIKTHKRDLLNKYRVPLYDGYLVTEPISEILNAETIGNNPTEALTTAADSFINFVNNTKSLLIPTCD